MAENTDTNKADKPETTKAVTAKQTGKAVEVTEEIVIPTNVFDATKPELTELAELTFRENVSKSYTNAELTDVTLVKINHHVGTSATYVYTGKLTA